MEGNVHPFVREGRDLGRADASLGMQRVTIMFKSTGEQQAALDTLLAEQQDPASANYHRWLSPEEFGDRFGLSQADVDKVASWLRGQGFTIDEMARNRRWIAFSGSAGQVEEAFQTSIHQYEIGGEAFYANSVEPAVPAALAEVVLGFRSLNNFRLRPRPHFTSSVSGSHFLSPSDFATIYNLKSLYAKGLDGSGQKIVIAGQVNIQLADIRAFRSASGLPASDPQVILVPGSLDPGSNSGDLGEADLDIEWSGAVARNAQIVYVTSRNGVMDSLQYAIDQNLAPVVSISYGGCEKEFTSQETVLLSTLGQLANAQGITILASSGDTGAADCDYRPNTVIATHGLAVDIPASLPSVTSLGGSEFREVTDSWNSQNDASNGSALGYIPETAWNDTTAVGQLASSGGGRSIYFPKPAWQVAPGVPNDDARDVPDVSLNASANHDGYLICTAGGCVDGYRSTTGRLTVAGGTSAGAPSFAGIVAILNQQTNSRQGNINPVLYRLASLVPAVFHDISSGDNQVACQTGTPDCPSGGTIGYSAAPGYDMATGLGSVDVLNLMTSWAAATASLNGSSSGSQVTALATTVPQPITDVEQGTIKSGYVIITPNANSAVPAAAVTFGMVSNGAVQSQAGILPLPMMTSASIFVEVIPGISRDLGIAIANPGAISNQITLTLRDQAGAAATSPVTVVLQPQQQLARFIKELFPASAIGAGFRGSVQMQSATPFSALALRFSGAVFSTLAVSGVSVSGVPTRTIDTNNVGGTSAIVLPQFAMSGGWATQIALVNDGSSTAAGRVDVFDTSGNPMPVSLNGVSQSTFTYSVPAGGTFLLAPRDANGQSPF